MIHQAIRCIDLVEVVTAWMDGALDDDTGAAMDEHLAGCPGCRHYVDQLRMTTALAARLAVVEEPAPDDLKARLLAAFRASPRGQGQAGK